MGGVLNAATEEREFEFTNSDFAWIQQGIHEHAGIALGPQKRDMVYSRVARRLRATGLTRFSEYVALLESAEGAAEWEHFVNSLTTNLTSFFREPHHFPMLAEMAQAHPSGLTVWCSAASTGEEPYSIAMTLAQAYRGDLGKFRILASDLDTEVLGKAALGVYPIERLDRVPEDLKCAWFQRGRGPRSGLARVKQALKDRIQFRQINLLQGPWPIRGPLDVIFCRNVMIYFDKPTQRQILSRFRPLLKPEGLLFAGHSESFHNAADLFRLIGKTVYRPVLPAGSTHGPR